MTGIFSLRQAFTLVCAAITASCLPAAHVFAAETETKPLYLTPSTHFARPAAEDLKSPVSEAMPALPSDTQEIGILPGYPADLGGWALFNTSTCAEISHGKYVVKTKPKYGKLAYKLVKGNISSDSDICPGAPGTFLTAYYTWTNDKSKVTKDFFHIEWEADTKKCTSNCTIDEPFLAVKGPRIFFYNVETEGYDDVTSSKTTVALGQVVYLTAEPVLSPQTPLWKVPGTTTGGYTPTSDSFATGKTVPTDFKNDYTEFFWLDPAAKREVIYTDKFDKRTLTASTTFDVVGPTDIKVTEKSGGIQLVSGNTLSYGTSSTPGVSFDASATTPSGFDASFQWMQLQTKDSIKETDGKTVTECTNGLGLDAAYPFAVGATAADTYQVSLPSADNTVTVEELNNMYLMWQVDTPDSIPVPLASISTNWSATAKQTESTHKWKLESSEHKFGKLVRTKKFPIWMTVVSTGTPTCN